MRKDKGGIGGIVLNVSSMGGNNVNKHILWVFSMFYKEICPEKCIHNICFRIEISTNMHMNTPYYLEKVKSRARECHNCKPQPFPDTKRKRKPINPNKDKSNKRTKSTKISSNFPPSRWFIILTVLRRWSRC